jgi:hypothetical protein
MSKTLNELASDLKDCIIDLQSDAHNKGNIRQGRYNNIKLVIDIASNPNPHVTIFVAMASAEFNLRTMEKINGGLGPDERYVLRWLSNPNVVEDLKDCWRQAERNRGRITDK